MAGTESDIERQLRELLERCRAEVVEYFRSVVEELNARAPMRTWWVFQIVPFTFEIWAADVGADVAEKSWYERPPIKDSQGDIWFTAEAEQIPPYLCECLREAAPSKPCYFCFDWGPKKWINASTGEKTETLSG